MDVRVCTYGGSTRNMQHTVVRVTIGRSRALIILVYGADPDRGETCILNVVEVLPDGVPSSTTPAGNEKYFNEGRKGRGTRSGPQVCKCLGLHQSEVHNGPSGVFRCPSEQLNYSTTVRCVLVDGARSPLLCSCSGSRTNESQNRKESGKEEHFARKDRKLVNEWYYLLARGIEGYCERIAWQRLAGAGEWQGRGRGSGSVDGIPSRAVVSESQRQGMGMARN